MYRLITQYQTILAKNSEHSLQESKKLESDKNGHNGKEAYANALFASK